MELTRRAFLALLPALPLFGKRFVQAEPVPVFKGKGFVQVTGRITAAELETIANAELEQVIGNVGCKLVGYGPARMPRHLIDKSTHSIYNRIG